MLKEVEIVGEAYFSPEVEEFHDAIVNGDTELVEEYLKEYKNDLPKETLKFLRGITFINYGQKVVKGAKKIVSTDERKKVKEEGNGWIGCGWYFLENLAIERGVDITENPFARDL